MTVPRTPKKYPLTAAEFEAVEPFLRNNKALSEDRIAAARMVMVENKTYQEAADLFGWNRPNVYSAVKAVWERYQVFKQSLPADVSMQSLTAPIPRGWKRQVVIAPSEMMVEILSMTERAKLDAVVQLRAKIAKANQEHPAPPASQDSDKA